MRVQLLYKTDLGIVDKTWSRKHTFIRRTQFSNDLWLLGHQSGDVWIIDLVQYGVVKNKELFFPGQGFVI